MKKITILVLSVLMCLNNVPLTVLAEEETEPFEIEHIEEQSENTVEEEPAESEEKLVDISDDYLPDLNKENTEINAVSPGTVEIANGECGDNLTWSFENNIGTKALIIEGFGAMSDYTYYNRAPWNDYAGEIDIVILPQELTSIGDFAFFGCGSGSEEGGIRVPESCAEIGESAFEGTNFQNIVLAGDLTSIDDYAFDMISENCIVHYGGTWSHLAEITGNYNETLFKQTVFHRCGDNLFWEIDDDNCLVISGEGEMWDFCETYSYNSDTGGGAVINSALRSEPRTSFGNIAPWDLDFHEFDGLRFEGTGEEGNENGITYIGNYAFSNSNFNEYNEAGITVELPASVIQLGYAAFSGGYDYVSYSVDPENKNFTAENGVLFNKDQTCLIRYPRAIGSSRTEEYSIPETVTQIAPYAFANNKYLEKINIPRTVTEIGDYAFYPCWSLQNVTYSGTAAEKDDIEIDWDTNTDLKNAQFTYLNELKDFDHEYAGGILTISGYGEMPNFSEQDPADWQNLAQEVTTVKIERGISAIGENAFSGFTNLKTLYLPRYLESAEDSAFTGVTLEHVYYAGKTTEFDADNFPLSFEGIVQFTNCGDDAHWDLENGLLTISGTGAIWDEEDFSVHTMPWYLQNESITEIQIGNEITRIGSRVFADLDIESFTVPSGVTEIGYNPVARCRLLKTINSNSTSFSGVEGALYSSDMTKLLAVSAGRKLTLFHVREGITTICSGAFDGLMDTGKLGNYFALIDLPITLQQVEPYAFACEDLSKASVRRITYPGTFDEFNSIEWNNFEGNNAIRNENVRLYFTKCGENLWWEYYSKEKTLTIYGSGPMWDFIYENSGGDTPINSVNPGIPSEISAVSADSPQEDEPYTEIVNFGVDDAPWIIAGFTDIEHIVFESDDSDPEEGVTYIGQKTFNSLSSLKSVTIPKTLMEIGYSNIVSENNIDFYYAGSEDDAANNHLPTFIDGTTWHFSNYNVTIYGCLVCDLTVTAEINGQVEELDSHTSVENGTELTISAVPKPGYMLNPYAPSTITVTENIIINPYDYVIKDKSLQNYTNEFKNVDTDVSDLFTLKDTETENQDTLAEKIDIARALNQEIRVDLQADEVDEENVDQDERGLVANVITDDAAVCDYYDIDLVVSTAEEILATVTETTTPVKVALPLSDAAQEAVDNEGQVKVVRIHDGETTVLDGTVQDGYITFETNKFSTYAMVFSQNGDPTEHECIDGDDNLICDICNNRLGFRIKLMSAIAGDETATADVTLKGEADYQVEESVTITAPTKSGFNFIGWYRGTMDGYGEELFTEQYSYTFKPIDDLCLWAVYVPSEVERSDLEAIHLAGTSLSLEGDIGVNFYMNIPAETAEEAIVKINLNGRTKKYVVSGLRPETEGYKFTVRAAAKEMRDTIQIWVEDSEGKRIQLLSAGGKNDYTDSNYRYSVARYFALARKNADIYADLQGLVNAMDIYGQYAQKYFRYKDFRNLRPESVDDAEIPQVIEQYKIRRDKDNWPEGLEYGGSNLTLETVTSFHHYFTVTDNHTIDQYTFMVDGEDVRPVWDEEKSMYKLSFSNIAAKDLAEFTRVDISDGVNNSYIEYCALSYARTSIAGELDSEDLCRALYKYYDEAADYFENH